MKENKSMQLKRSIQKKLMAATSMLMVAVIMMVSSTYAWFTLSTAPEVTGITTAVGANGNLEIALANADTWADHNKVTSQVGDSGKAPELANVTWGNIVDVSKNEFYGLDKIILMPSKLNVTDDGLKVNAAYLKTPEYGADGRISALKAETYTGVYNTTTQSFTVNGSEYGVRAVGTASAMTPRQSAYRNARFDLSNNASNAKMYAAQSLNKYGADLADLVLKYALNSTSAEFSTDNVAAIRNVVNELSSSVTAIDAAINAAIKGFAASAEAQKTLKDDAYNNIEGSLTLANVKDGKITVGENEVALPEYITAAITKRDSVNTNITSASETLATLEEKSKDNPDVTYTWTEISPALTTIVNPDKATVNKLTVEQLKTDDGKSQLVSKVANGEGIRVELPSGTGVYADIAELGGNYSASIVIEKVNYGGMNLTNVKAGMVTDVAGTPLFDACDAAITLLGAPIQGDVTSDTAITDTYGYAIDMLFRTNAAESNLLLQTKAIDRIYSDNTALSDTMGGGSTMTFTTKSTTFTTDNVKALMSNIKVVFMDKQNVILAYADLDVANATVVGSDVTADIRLYKLEPDTTTNGDAGDEGAATVAEGDTTGENTTVAMKKVYLEGKDAVITPLTQNTPIGVTALVYLDGETIDNSMVANAQMSMEGSMNLQFSSSATLVPMKNTALQQSGTGASSEETQESSEATEASSEASQESSEANQG